MKEEEDRIMSSPQPNKPFVKSLPKDTIGNTELLKPPLSNNLISGFVSLAPKEEVGRHSTGNYEEMLIILSGTGELEIKGQANIPITANQVGYLPPDTGHNVINDGNEPLNYVFIVTKKC